MSAKIEKLECWALRAPVEQPVRNAFGAMTTRPAIFLRLSAADGAWGWGEVWANFPPVGAEHRARLAKSIFAPLVAGMDSSEPAGVRALLEQRTHIMALQCAEPGPFAQVIAAIDQACWDLAGRRAGTPLWKLLGGKSNRVRVYASGLGPDAVVDMALARRAEGFRAFKLKVGMDVARDRENLEAMRKALGAEATLMVDANQGWTPEQAPARIAELMPHALHWIEEPIAADKPHDEWRALAKATGAPIAAGENLRGAEEFESAIDAGYLRFVQPDIGKWGGVTGCREVARRAVAKGLAYCPHWLAGGVGLAASMHLLAATGGDGYAEVDANPNPLREEVFPLRITDGWATLPDAPGLGAEPELRRLKQFLVD